MGMGIGRAVAAALPLEAELARAAVSIGGAAPRSATRLASTLEHVGRDGRSVSAGFRIAAPSPYQRFLADTVNEALQVRDRIAAAATQAQSGADQLRPLAAELNRQRGVLDDALAVYGPAPVHEAQIAAIASARAGGAPDPHATAAVLDQVGLRNQALSHWLRHGVATAGG